MIIGFENETHELNDFEKTTLLPMMIKGLETKIGKDKAITNKKMIAGFKNLGYKVAPARIRKLIHHIRITGVIERLVSSSKGYYISNDKNEIDSYITSLIQRAESIEKIADQLKYQRNKMKD